MYSHGIVICLLPVGTHEFFPLGEKPFGKIRDFRFFVEIQEKKRLSFWKIRKFSSLTKL